MQYWCCCGLCGPFQVHVLVVNSGSWCFIWVEHGWTKTQSVKLAFADKPSGVLPHRRLEPYSALYLKTLLLVANWLLNASVGWKALLGVWAFYIVCAHTHTLFRDLQLQLLFMEPVTTCLRALFAQDGAQFLLHKATSLLWFPKLCFIISVKPFNLRFLNLSNLRGLESKCLNIPLLSVPHPLPRVAWWSHVMVKSLCSEVRLGPCLKAVWPDFSEPQWSHLWSRGSNTYCLGLLWALNAVTKFVIDVIIIGVFP